MPLRKLYHAKQIRALVFAQTTDFFMLINSGAKRTGKTIINNDLFLKELRRVRKIADELGIQLPQYILAGADLGALNRNVLVELTNKYGIEFKFDKHNRFILFGVQVCCFGHSKINDLNRIRGMTSFGAYVNEASLANQEVFDEIKSRCSGEGARILVDTNPADPMHWLKLDYIDKSDGKTIETFHYELDDNTFLSERYRENIKKSTPSGMFYDRNIKGLWCTAEGAIYEDFDKNIHYVKASTLDNINFVKYFAGVDWGWEHYGSVVLIGVDDKGDKYLIKEIAKKHKHIEYWLEEAKKIIKEYGNISFYCDSARPDYVKKFRENKIKALNARKDVVAGISEVASLFKQRKLKVVEDNVDIFKTEIYNYVWKEGKDEPVKQYDDVLDSLRYAIYSDLKYGNVRENQSR